MSAIVACPACGAKNRVPAAAPGLPACAKCEAKLPWLTGASDTDFDAVADSAKVPVLVDLWAPWCGPCLQVAPHLQTLAVERAGRLKVVKVLVDDNPRTQARFGAQSIPTMVLLHHGAEVSRQVGALPLPALRRWVDQQLARTS